MTRRIELETPERFMLEILKKAKEKIVGHRITAVRYMTDSELKESYWHQKGIVLELDNGELLFPLSDEEGNSPGVLATTIKDFETIGRF